MSLILSGDAGVTFPNSTVQASAGSVLQVVNAVTTTSTNNASQTYVDTTLTATITPKFSTSKIAIFINHSECVKSASSSSNAIALKIQRNGSDVVEFTYDAGYQASAMVLYFPISYAYVDSPASTSALTYKTQFKNSEATGNVGVQTNSKPATIILMEIAG